MFTEQQLKVIRYCAEECARQHSGEESVADMLAAWDWVASPHGQYRVTLDFIEHIGKLVEPHDNASGFRQIRIYVGNAFQSVEKAPWERVPELLSALLESYYEGVLFADTPETRKLNHNLAKTAEDQFYYEYENIHPFRDGNGRSGKILYNYLLGRLDDPVMPPNFWGSSNP